MTAFSTLLDGTPEPEDDGDLVATLVREAFEENQIRVGPTAYLGYQEVHRPGRARYAQVRMASSRSSRRGRLILMAAASTGG